MGLLLPAAVAGVASQATGAVKDGEGAIRIVVNPHLGPPIVRPDRARRNLQAPAVATHRVVVADLTLLPDAQDIGKDRWIDRDGGGARLPGGDRKAGVVGGRTDLAEEAVGLLDGGEPGERQLLRQVVLQRAKGTLAAPPRLRRTGRNVLDAGLRQRPAHLGLDLYQFRPDQTDVRFGRAPPR